RYAERTSRTRSYSRTRMACGFMAGEGRARRGAARSRGLVDVEEDLVVLREAAGGPLGGDELPIHLHLEGAAGALDELRLHSEFLLDGGGQTGRPGLVVSDPAVLDRDERFLHGSPIDRPVAPSITPPRGRFNPTDRGRGRERARARARELV